MKFLIKLEMINPYIQRLRKKINIFRQNPVLFSVLS